MCDDGYLQWYQHYLPHRSAQPIMIGRYDVLRVAVWVLVWLCEHIAHCQLRVMQGTMAG